jgi:predicted permease
MFAIKSKTIRSFQSQISIFVGVYVVGEVLELNGIQAITKLPADTGSQIHVAATIIITAILLSRLFYSGKVVKKLVDHDGSADQKR